MHEMLAQKYVDAARAYERADDDCAPLPGSAEQLAFALVSVARERDDALERLRQIVRSYDKAIPMRTADFHNPSCLCLRCAVDAARTS